MQTFKNIVHKIFKLLKLILQYIWDLFSRLFSRAKKPQTTTNKLPTPFHGQHSKTRQNESLPNTTPNSTPIITNTLPPTPTSLPLTKSLQKEKPLSIELIHTIIDEILNEKNTLTKPNPPLTTDLIETFKEQITPQIIQQIHQEQIKTFNEIKLTIGSIIEKELPYTQTLTSPPNNSTPTNSPQTIKPTPHSVTATIIVPAPPQPIDSTHHLKNPKSPTEPSKTSAPLETPINTQTTSAPISPINENHPPTITPSNPIANQEPTPNHQPSPSQPNKPQINKAHLDETKQGKAKPKETQTLIDQKQTTQPKEDPVLLLKLPNLTKELDHITTQINIQNQKEDIEDKSYTEILNTIDTLLLKIESLIIQNSPHLSKDQLSTLESQKQKLHTLKTTIAQTQKKDISLEKQLLNEPLTTEQKNRLKDEIQKLCLETQLAHNDALLKDLESIPYLTPTAAAQLEKQIIKLKIRQALRTLELPILFALPFIRNRYFLYFTTGLLIHNHFHFLNNMFLKRPINISLPDWDTITTGANALDKAIDMTYSNIIALENLEHLALTKYPELITDYEFQKSLNSLKKSLNTSYNRLIKKHQYLSHKFLKPHRLIYKTHTPKK